MGDFNAKVGRNLSQAKEVGKYGLGETNERGERLIEFAMGNNLYIANTFFEKPDTNKWTWHSPDWSVKNQIDYILNNKNLKINDVEVITNLDIGSDHRALGAKIENNETYKKKFYPATLPRMKTENLIKTNYERTLRELFTKDDSYNSEINDMNTKINECMKEAYEETRKNCKKNNNNKSCRNYPSRIQNLMKKRRKFIKNNTIHRIDYVELCKTIRSEIKKWQEEKELERITTALTNNTALKNKEQKRTLITSMKDKNGTERYQNEEILKIIKEFYEELYKNDTEELNGENSELEQNTNRSAQIENVEPILKDEIEWAVEGMKDSKAGGSDGIMIEQIKAGGKTVINALQKLFNRCLEDRKVPKEWLQSKLVLLKKKGSGKDIKNYRPLSLLQVSYKIFTKIIINRMDSIFNIQLNQNQAGFRSGFSTLDHIHVVNELVERANTYNFKLCLVFIDFEKAFDKVKTNAILEVLNNYGIPNTYIQIFKYIYENSTAKIKINGQQETEINISRGVKQGDTSSPKLFIMVLTYVFSKLDWEDKGILVNGKPLTRLKFADDIVLIAKDEREAQNMINELNSETEKVGLRMNRGKCKWMYINNDNEDVEDVKLEGEAIERVEKFTYLGQTIGAKGQEEEINKRCGMGWSSFLKNITLYKSKAPLEMKKKLWMLTVLPIMTYGAETWVFNKRVRDKLRTTQRAQERIMLNITRRDKKRITWIKQKTGIEDIVKLISKRKWQWAGHTNRRKDERWTKEIQEWNMQLYKRKRGRPTLKWDNEFKIVCGRTWKRVTEFRREWKRLAFVFREVWLEQ